MPPTHLFINGLQKGRFRATTNVYLETGITRLVLSFSLVPFGPAFGWNGVVRHVHKLDERRFSMYSTHLRDMYNFDPLEMERFLKEMRLLAAQGQTAAQAMKSKPAQGNGETGAQAVGNGKVVANEAAGTKAVDENGDQEKGTVNSGTTVGRREAAGPPRGNQSRGSARYGVTLNAYLKKMTTDWHMTYGKVPRVPWSKKNPS